MARKKQNNLDTISGSIVCTETNIKITDEKLRGVLLKTYEAARQDAQKFKIYKHYGVFLSAAFSLIIPLLTSDFKSFGVLTAERLTIFCWIAFAIMLGVGIILVLIYASRSASCETKERDDTVEAMLRMLQPQNQDDNKE